MASYSWRDVVTHTIEFVIPSGDAMAEFSKAYNAACNTYCERHGLALGGSLPDDWARVYARDDEVVIAFDVKEKRAA